MHNVEEIEKFLTQNAQNEGIPSILSHFGQISLILGILCQKLFNIVYTVQNICSKYIFKNFSKYLQNLFRNFAQFFPPHFGHFVSKTFQNILYYTKI